MLKCFNGIRLGVVCGLGMAILMLLAFTSCEIYINGGNNSTVKITSTVTEVIEGKIITLTATVEGSGKGVTWKSSDTAVAVVAASDGTVTGITAGKVTITATSVEDPSQTDDVTITVKAKTVKITSTVTEVTEGNTIPLTATVEGSDKGVTWKSSATAVAVVATNDGTVTGVKAGNVKITATSVEDPSQTDDVTITVKAKSQ